MPLLPLHDLRSPFGGYVENPLWRAMRDEAREVAWLIALVGALSVAGVVAAVLLAIT